MPMEHLLFFWTTTGKKVRASGTDGIVPVIGVNAAGYWTLDYGSGPVELKDAADNPMKAKGASVILCSGRCQ